MSLFKGTLLALASLLVLLLAYNQYVQTKEHNLNVLTQMRLCLSSENSSEDGKKQCANVVKQQAIFPEHLYKKEGLGFDEKL